MIHARLGQIWDGADVGIEVGMPVGRDVGADDGGVEGTDDGGVVGTDVGTDVGGKLGAHDGVEVGTVRDEAPQTGDLPVHGCPMYRAPSYFVPRVNVALLCQGFDPLDVAVAGCRDERVYCGHWCRCCESLDHQCTLTGSSASTQNQAKTKPLSGDFL